MKLEQLGSLVLTFQGGYSAKGVQLSALLLSPSPSSSSAGPASGTSDSEAHWSWLPLAQVWPEDSNARQTFRLSLPPSSLETIEAAAFFRLELQGSADSFGRVTLYGVELWTR